MKDIEDYKQELAAAQDKLMELIQRRHEIDVEIANVRRIIGGFSAIVGEVPVQPDITNLLTGAKRELGLTASCREVFLAYRDQQLTPTEVMEAMMEMGLHTKSYPNILASIHTTLRRMADGEGAILNESVKNGKKAYQLKPFKYVDQRRAHEERQKKQTKR